jgi:hypothetical protein
MMATPCDVITEQMGLLYTCSQIGQYIRIQTPYLYPDGDIIDIFLQGKGNTGTLTDLGETLRWLRMQTVTQRQSSKQLQLITDICLTHNVEFYHGMLTVRVKRVEDFAADATRLAQCALRVSDLWFTFRNKMGESIVDDVEDLLRENNVEFKRSPKIVGRSTKSWRPDFQTRGKEHSSFVRVLSTGSRAVARDQVFQTTSMWHDLNNFTVGKEAIQLISLFDDTADVWTQEDIQLVASLSDIAFWSRPDEFLEKVA